MRGRYVAGICSFPQGLVGIARSVGAETVHSRVGSVETTFTHKTAPWKSMWFSTLENHSTPEYKKVYSDIQSFHTPYYDDDLND